MQVSEALRSAELPQMSVRLMTITGFLCALCFTGSPLHGDDTAKKSQERAVCFEDLLGNIVEKSTATLLSSLRVEKAIEKSLWKTVLSPAALTREEQLQLDGDPRLHRGILLVQLIVSNESEVAEKQRLAPLAEGVQIQVLYDVLKRKVDRPLASIYYIEARQSREPLVPIAAFFTFDGGNRKWSRVPSPRRVREPK
jgi:hypothetical protein